MRYRTPILLAVLALLVIGIVPDASAAGTLPELALRLWPNPNVAERGDVIRYDLTIANQGEGKASRTNVTLPFPAGRMVIVRTEFSHATTWVMEVADDKVVVMFGTLRSGEERTAKLYFVVAPDAPAGQFTQRATARYDEDEGTRLRSNEVSVTITGGEPAVAQPATRVEPAQGPAGTQFRFLVSNYFPEEKLFTWLNAPGEVLATDLQGKATEQGSAEFSLDSRTLAPGAYSFVVLGGSSGITTVTPFEIR